MTFTTFPTLRPTLQPLLPRDRRSLQNASFHITALKLWYLLYFGAQYTQLFIPLILQSLMSFSPATIGTVMSIRRIIVSLFAPLFSILCDISGAHRLLITMSLICYYCCTAVLTSLRALIPVALTLFLRDAFLAGVEPALNAATLAKVYELDQSGLKATFGDIRSFGSVGWGLMSFGVPFACSYWFPMHPYTSILLVQVGIGVFVVALTACGVDLSQDLFSRYGVFSVAENDDIKNDEAVMCPTKVTQKTRFEGALRYCIAAIFLQGIVIGALQTTLFLYMAQMGFSKSVMGLSVLIGSIFECTFFFMGGKWRSGSVDDAQSACKRDILRMRIGMLLNGIMLLLYVSLSSIPSQMMTVMVLFVAVCSNGSGSALFLCSAISVASSSAPPEWRTGAQGIVQSVLYGIGPAVGALIGGICMEKVGVHVLYGGLAAADVAMVTLMR